MRIMEKIKANKFNPGFKIDDKHGKVGITIKKLLPLDPLKEEQIAKVHLRVIDQKELVVYDQSLNNFLQKSNLTKKNETSNGDSRRPLNNKLYTNEILVEEYFAIADHLTVKIIADSDFFYEFDVLFDIEKKDQIK